ncbi:TetR family transcriptional regulator [Actinacidiphila sp. ITFR-21]|uniref:TetR family transcriptional regulator n=1 Tax=Actinacidiphila sp. ITFR-21 TaxID=3075199 RepID=UPI00288BCB72|nr:TetR family transcriptional regulator [Streptomyces sp. ITFR-21]WNI20125.1 TetR family transcriptional regulator [Streptomyces sp. ITFR-21]
MSTALGLLGEQSYRDVTAVEIARAAGTSPATLYQYFAGVDEIVLDAVENVAQATAMALSEFADGTWATKGLPGAEQLVVSVLDCWSEHKTVLRIVTAVAAEVDPRFVQAFKSVTRPVTRALASAVSRPMPSASARTALVHHLVVMLVSSAGAQQRSALTAGLSGKAQRDALVQLVHAFVAAPDGG